MKVIDVKDAAGMISDGSTVAVSGFSWMCFPEYIIKAVEDRFLETAQPKDLTLFTSVGMGYMNYLGHKGLAKRCIATHYGNVPAFQELIKNNEVEAYLWPQGIMAHFYRDMAGKKPGTISKVGMKTFIDPRIEGGKVNAAAKEDLIEVIKLDGEEYLRYKPIKFDVAIIRGTYADENGNLSMEDETVLTEAYHVAAAARAGGGKVIAQVSRIVANGSIPAKSVRVPGVLVDYVVVAPIEYHKQTKVINEPDPCFSSRVRIPLDAIPPLPMSERKIIARRAAMELIPNSVVNFGAGMPGGIPSVATEENISEAMTFSVESGAFGGVTAPVPNFGAIYNCEAMVTHDQQFDFCDGGNINQTFLGLAQMDQFGNVNVSKFGKAVGPGGFINLSQNIRNVVFVGTFTVGGLEVRIDDGKLVIVNEGRNKKILKHVEQITFSGEFAIEAKQNVTYITERCVFKLDEQGLVLTEVAPGIDLKTQVLDLIDFPVRVAENVKLMDARIFRDEPMGIHDEILSKLN